MNSLADFTADEVQSAITGKKFHTWEEIARDVRLWVALLRKAMFSSGRGYRRASLRHTGKQDAKTGEWDRRKDKIEGPFAFASKALRSYAARYACPPIRLTEKSRRRHTNLMRGI